MSKAPVRDPLLPVEWEQFDLIDTLNVVLYNVRFFADFGIFRAGEVLPVISVDYGKGTAIIYDDEGNVLREQRFTATPVKTEPAAHLGDSE